MAEPHSDSGWMVFAHSIEQYGRVCADVKDSRTGKTDVGLTFMCLMSSRKLTGDCLKRLESSWWEDKGPGKRRLGGYSVLVVYYSHAHPTVGAGDAH